MNVAVGGATEKPVVVVKVGDLERADAGNRLEVILRSLSPRSFPVVLVGRSSSRQESARTLVQALLEQSAKHAKLIVDTSNNEAVKSRLIFARKVGAEKQLIASASVIGSELIVLSCEPKLYRVDTKRIPALAKLSLEHLKGFSLSESGSGIHWASHDVDINLETIRTAIEPTLKRAAELAARNETLQYARAIRRLRESLGLTQSAIVGVSEREVRRLENAETKPHSKTLALLARAHEMDVDEYVRQLAKLASSTETKTVRRKRKRVD